MVDLNEPRIKALIRFLSAASLAGRALEGVRNVGGASLTASARAYGLSPKFYSYTPKELDFIEAHLKVQGIF